MKFFKANPLLYVTILLFFYTIYDYFEHIGRKDSIFQEYPWHWLSFSIMAFLSFVLMVYSIKTLTERIVKKHHLLIEAFAFTIWMVSYLLILGPIIDTLFWPKTELTFDFKPLIMVIPVAIFIVIRILLNLLIKKPIMYSK